MTIVVVDLSVHDVLDPNPASGRTDDDNASKNQIRVYPEDLQKYMGPPANMNTRCKFSNNRYKRDTELLDIYNVHTSVVALTHLLRCAHDNAPFLDWIRRKWFKERNPVPEEGIYSSFSLLLTGKIVT